jgi:hypothetical protein
MIQYQPGEAINVTWHVLRTESSNIRCRAAARKVHWTFMHPHVTEVSFVYLYTSPICDKTPNCAGRDILYTLTRTNTNVTGIAQTRQSHHVGRYCDQLWFTSYDILYCVSWRAKHAAGRQMRTTCNNSPSADARDDIPRKPVPACWRKHGAILTWVARAIYVMWRKRILRRVGTAAMKPG